MAYEFDKEKVLEYLSMNPEDGSFAEVEEEILSEYDPEAIERAQRLDTIALASVLDDIDSMKKEFDAAIHSVEAAENGYSEAMYLAYRLARREYPFSEEGRNYMLHARLLREEYEDRFGPMITGITPENASVFADLIEPDTIEEIEQGVLKGFALVRHVEGRLNPVGAVVYNVIPALEETVDAPILDVSWFYVLPEMRGRKYSDLLMGELINLAIRKETESITVRTPVDESYEAFLQLFSEWHFMMAPGINSECVFRFGDAKPSKDALRNTYPLTAFREDERSAFIGGFLYHMGERELVGKYLSKEPSSYDAEVSCFTGTVQKPTGLILAHIKPSGNVQARYYGCLSDFNDTAEDLFSGFIARAKKKYGADAVGIIDPDGEDTEEILDELIPSQPVFPTFNAILSAEN